MHIAIVNPYDLLPSETKRRGRYTMLSDELASRGHKVTWISSNFSHRDKQYRQKSSTYVENDNIQIKLVPTLKYYKNVDLRRIINQKVYASGVLKTLRLLQVSEPLHLVVASIPPTESARVAMKFCTEVDIPGIVDMQDAWPRVIEAVFPRFLRGFFSTTLLRSFHQDVQIAAEQASGLVAVSPDYLDYLKMFRQVKKQVHQAIFPLGFDNQKIWVPEIKKSKGEHPLIVSYIGNFGRFYDLKTVLNAAILCSDRNIQFILIGEGSDYDKIKGIKETLDIRNVNIKGYLDFELAVPILLQSDIGLLPYTSDFPSNVTNKVFDYLSLGIPVVSSLKGTFEEKLKELKIGFQYEAGNADSLAAALYQADANREQLLEMSTRGIEYAEKKMTGYTIYKQYVDFIEKYFI